MLHTVSHTNISYQNIVCVCVIHKKRHDHGTNAVYQIITGYSVEASNIKGFYIRILGGVLKLINTPVDRIFKLKSTTIGQLVDVWMERIYFKF